MPDLTIQQRKVFAPTTPHSVFIIISLCTFVKFFTPKESIKRNIYTDKRFFMHKFMNICTILCIKIKFYKIFLNIYAKTLAFYLYKLYNERTQKK